MKPPRFSIFPGSVFLGLALVLAGCAPSKTERAARERARIEQEDQSRPDADLANKAITGMNQKLGRKPPDLKLGVPPEKKTEAVSQPAGRP